MTVEPAVTPEPHPADVSATPAVAQVEAAPQSQDANTPAPSAGKDESLMDRVTAALKPKTEGSSPSPVSQDAKDPNASPEGEEKEPEGDPTDEEMARLHSATRRRMKKLLSERNSANDGKVAAESKVAELTPHAEVGRRVTEFISNAGMTGDEANLLLEIGKNLKVAPEKAFEQLKPYYSQLQRMFGEVLPDDLQQAVDRKEITADYAREFARTRTQSQLNTRRVETVSADLDRRSRTEQTQRHAEAIGNAISTWDRNQEAGDPDWKLKQSRIGELIELDVRRNGYPQTAQAAIDQAERAKTTVNAEIARFQPRKLAVNSVNPASAARVAPAKPKTALEAATMALASAG